jgi:hypothetical protein
LTSPVPGVGKSHPSEKVFLIVLLLV